MYIMYIHYIWVSNNTFNILHNIVGNSSKKLLVLNQIRISYRIGYKKKKKKIFSFSRKKEPGSPKSLRSGEWGHFGFTSGWPKWCNLLNLPDKSTTCWQLYHKHVHSSLHHPFVSVSETKQKHDAAYTQQSLSAAFSQMKQAQLHKYTFIMLNVLNVLINWKWIPKAHIQPMPFFFAI